MAPANHRLLPIGLAAPVVVAALVVGALAWLTDADPATEADQPTGTEADQPSGSHSGADSGSPSGGEAGLASLVGSEKIVPLDIEVIATHPHDPDAYTQGLEFVDGLLVESTGLLGRSTLRLVEPTGGDVIRSTAIDDELFGEGATVVGDAVWQLTWRGETAILHGLDDFTERRRVSYAGEGWGLCAASDRLVMSDGSSRLTFRDRDSFEAIGTIEVTADGRPVAKLNELECVGQLVLANVYQTTRLLVIDPSTGRVVGEADLADLVPPGYEGDGTNVANGIAHNPETGRFWLTGKRWPLVHEAELLPEPQPQGR